MEEEIKAVELNEVENNTTEQTTATETKAETPKVEPLPEQKPFLMSPYERAILTEMERRATDNPALAEGLKDKGKNIQECFAFVTNRAKKMATDVCAMIEDNVVYAWAQFYYTQRKEIIELELKPKQTYTPPTKPATPSKTDTKKKDEKKTETKPKAETKPAEKEGENVTEVKGADGKTHTITELSLF